MLKSAPHGGLLALPFSILLVLAACSRPADRSAEAPPTVPAEAPPAAAAPAASPTDPHSYSRPDQVAVKHLNLDLTVDFVQKKLVGKARSTWKTRPARGSSSSTHGIST